MTTNVNVKSDTYGAMQISEKKALMDIHFDNYSQLNNENQIYKETSGTGSITYNANTNSAVLAISAQNDFAYIQSQHCIVYVPANTIWLYVSCNFNLAAASTTNITCDIGMIEPDSGIFLRYQNGVLQFVIRHKNQSGTTVEEVQNISSFTIDKLDGTGDSGVTFSDNKQYLFAFQMQFLYSGRVRLYILTDKIYPLTNIDHSGIETFSYIQNANLPFTSRLYATNTGSAISAYSTAFTCMSLQFFGRDTFYENFYSFAYNKSDTVSGNATKSLVIFRVKNGYYKQIHTNGFQLLCESGKQCRVNIYMIRNDQDTSFANLSFVDYNTTRSVVQLSTAATQVYNGSKKQLINTIFLTGQSETLTNIFSQQQIFGCFHKTGFYDYIEVECVNLQGQTIVIYLATEIIESV